MPTYIALLRGINVSGQKLIIMADLQAHFESFGATQVRTYIQSGNVVFAHRTKTSAPLRRDLEKHLAAKLGYAVPTLVKSSKEFATIAEANPYDTTLPKLGKRVYVCFFEKAPASDAIKSILSLTTGDERLTVIGDAGYACYFNGLGRAKLNSNIIERKLGMTTLRNWNTVNALLELAQPKSLA